MSSQRGEISLPGLLISCVIVLVVLGATLTLFDGFTARAADQARRTDAEDEARRASDRIARDLRNLSSPVPGQPDAVDVASEKDLVFQSVDPTGPNAGSNATNTRRVRYCLDAGGRLQQQTQTWTTATVPDTPSRAACPGDGWTRTVSIAQNIVNGAVPLFTYDAAAVKDISQVHVELHVDTDLTRPPAFTPLSTGVFLRNQNRRPLAVFTATRTQGGFVLNGSASSDPEGDPLEYAWFDGTEQVGSGITFTWTGLAPGSSHSVSLRVTDPGTLYGVSATQGLIG